MYRGSRKHILDWAEAPQFLPELLALAEPVPCRVTSSSRWRPLGYKYPAEAQLDEFGPLVRPDGPWEELANWWLVHKRGANTPNWDLALFCDIDGTPGVILVEAKANVPELSDGGMRQHSKWSSRSTDNRDRIATAILQAREALTPSLPGICIDRDKHYQLSNRLAFAWKLASLGLPTVLIYLGFVGDEGIRDVGPPFADHSKWSEELARHVQAVCPSPLFERRIDTPVAPFWVLCRSRPVLEVSGRRLPNERVKLSGRSTMREAAGGGSAAAGGSPLAGPAAYPK